MRDAEGNMRYAGGGVRTEGGGVRGSVAEPELVEPKLLGTWSRSRN